MATVDILMPSLKFLKEQAEASLTHSVSRAVITPGRMPAWDNCDCGLLYVRLLMVAPKSTDGRVRRGSTAGCGVLMWEVTLGIGVLRCAATINDSGEIPSVRQIEADSGEMTQDLMDLRDFLNCTDGISEITSWAPVGVEGGCHGGEWIFKMDMQ